MSTLTHPSAIVFVFIPFGFLVAQNVDSTRVFPQQEVLVAGSGKLSGAHRGLEVTRVSGSALDAFGAGSLAGSIASLPGMTVKDYGSLAGIKTISQRGMGAEHTAVFLNGFRLSSVQNGLVDFAIISLVPINAVELIRGGSSAQFGSDAVAGAVNIITTAPQPTALSARGSVGSFGLRSGSAAYAGRAGEASFQVGMGAISSTGNDPVEFINGSDRAVVPRPNADFSSRWITLQGMLMINGATVVKGYASATGTERGVSGKIVSLNPVSAARLEDADQIVQLSVGWAGVDSSMTNLGGQLRHTRERYTDSLLLIGGTELQSDFENTEIRLVLNDERLLASRLFVRGGAEAVTVRGSGSAMNAPATRHQAAIFATLEYAVVQTDPGLMELLIIPSSRIEAASGFTSEVTRQLSLMSRVRLGDDEASSSVTMRASVGNSFRLPTFNELSWNGGGGFGNPRLLPERSKNADVSVRADASAMGTQSISATYFSSTMENRIVWVSAAQGGVTPKNVRSVWSRGLEVGYSWLGPGKLFRLESWYTRMLTTKEAADFVGDPNVGKQAIFVPREILSAQLTSALPTSIPWIPTVAPSVRLHHESFRYTTDDNVGFLPAFTTWDVSVGVELSIGGHTTSLQATVNNVSDARYSLLQGYPMQGRSFQTTLTFKL